MSEIDPNAQVSVEQDGRVLSGVGVDAEQLRETMDRRAPADEAADSPPAGTETAPESASADLPQQKPTKGQARYSELANARKTAEAERDAIRKEFEDYKAKASQTPVAQSAIPASPERSSAAAPSGGDSAQPSKPTRPEPTEDEVGPGLKYETYGAFVKDQSAWVWEQQQSNLQQLVRQQFEQQRTSQQRQALAESTWAKGRTAYKDFDAVMQSGSVQFPWEALDLIYAHPQSEHLQYAILKDSAVGNRLSWIAQHQPHAFGLELLKLAPAAPAVSTASTGTVGVIPPPAPMQPVGSGSPTTTPTSAEAARLGNYEAYKARRSAERGVRRR